MSGHIDEQEMRFDARDGYSLSGLIIAPSRPKAAVLVSSGTGFPKELYRRIARQGAEMVFACLLYDYRGITGSASESLDEFRTDILEWARLDFSAALDQAQTLALGKPVFTLGHSVGAHLLGFADNALTPSGHAFICAGSGYWGGHKPLYSAQALFFWLVYGPLCLAMLGKIPAGGIWGGTALPAGIFRQWREWAFKPGYFGDILDEYGPHHFDDLTAPIRNWGFVDDELATLKSMHSLMSIYGAAPKEIIRLSPETVGAKHVGHFGAFKRHASQFWPEPFKWFDELLSEAH
jgi:predicted alpha/beta hydrolase